MIQGRRARFASRLPLAVISRAVGAEAREFSRLLYFSSDKCTFQLLPRTTRLNPLQPARSSSDRELWQRGEYTISTDRSRLDIDLIHDFISNHSYWGTGRAREVVERSIENSMAFGVYHGEQQVGFGRIVTDYATFAWVADVFVVPEHRGRGLSKWLMEVIIAHPQLQGFRRWVLATKDAQGLYEQFGFIKLHRPERWMERPDPNMKESPDYWRR
jgi:GNAT superfamily N-acetyltransferase